MENRERPRSELDAVRVEASRQLAQLEANGGLPWTEGDARALVGTLRRIVELATRSPADERVDVAEADVIEGALRWSSASGSLDACAHASAFERYRAARETLLEAAQRLRDAQQAREGDRDELDAARAVAHCRTCDGIGAHLLTCAELRRKLATTVAPAPVCGNVDRETGAFCVLSPGHDGWCSNRRATVKR